MARRRSSGQEELAQAVVRLLRTRGGVRNLLLLIGIVLIVGAVLYLREQAGQRERARGAPPPPVPGTAPAPAPSRGDLGPLRIATWNLRKFSDRADNPPDLVTIARIIRSNRFDVVVIQEVQRTGQVVERLRRQLNEPWRHVVSDATGNNERYGVLWRSDRAQLLEAADGFEPPRLLSGPRAAILDRAPFAASFRAGGFDFTLVSVHLWYGDKANNPRRQREAAALRDLAVEMASRGPERDVIVLGDFNEMRAGGNLHLFEQVGWSRLNDRPTNLGDREVYDNLLIDPRHTREFTGSAGAVAFDVELFADDDRAATAAVSDHRPAWAEFSTAGPDDD